MQTYLRLITQSGTLKPECVLVPLGSPTGVPNWSYVHVPRVTAPWSSRACRGRAVSGGAWDGYRRVGTRWVYRVGNTGTYRPSPLLARRVLRQRSGPRKPLPGGWSGWSQCSGAPAVPEPTLRARSVSLQEPSLVLALLPGMPPPGQ